MVLRCVAISVVAAALVAAIPSEVNASRSCAVTCEYGSCSAVDDHKDCSCYCSNGYPICSCGSNSGGKVRPQESNGG